MEALGLNLQQFLFQFGNFALLMLGLTYLLHKPLTKLLEDRKNTVKESLELNERLKTEMAEAEASREALLAETRQQTTTLLQDTKAQATKLEEQLRSEAEAKAQKLLEKAQGDLASEREKLRQDLRGELADMVVQTTEKILSETISKTDKQKHIEKVVKDLPL